MKQVVQGLFNKIVLLSGFALCVSSLEASDHFRNLREDQYVPVDCRDFELEDFSDVNDWFVYGIDGYQDRGFDYEYPLSRSHASWLWSAFRYGREPSTWPKALENEVKIIKEYKDPMGFDFGSEGEVLELLVLVDLEKRYSPRDYFMTGGLAYHEAHGNRIIGELDILVGNKKTCQIIAVGEAKLGVSGLGKAREQIARFKGFLRSQIRSFENFFTLTPKL